MQEEVQVEEIDDEEPVNVARVLVVDDDEMVRRAMARWLDREPDFKVVAEAATYKEGLDASRAHEVDLALLDFRLPDGSGIDLCRTIHQEHPAIKVVMLTGAGMEDETVQAAIVAGALGYVLKPAVPIEVLRVLRMVAKGEAYLDPIVTGGVLVHLRAAQPAADPAKLALLTQQEQMIMALVAEGKTNKEIAGELFLSDKTVKNYVSSILSKLNLERRAQVGALLSGRRV